MSQMKNILIVGPQPVADRHAEALRNRGYGVRFHEQGELSDLADIAAVLCIASPEMVWESLSNEVLAPARGQSRPVIAALAGFDSALRDRFLIQGVADLAPEGDPEDAASRVETVLEGWIRLGRRRALEARFKAQRGRQVFNLEVSDIDAGGMSLPNPEGLRRGELLRVALNLPDGPLVVWGRVSADSGRPALRFLALRSSERRRIAAAVIGAPVSKAPAPLEPSSEQNPQKRSPTENTLPTPASPGRVPPALHPGLSSQNADSALSSKTPAPGLAPMRDSGSAKVLTGVAAGASAAPVLKNGESGISTGSSEATPDKKQAASFPQAKVGSEALQLETGSSSLQVEADSAVLRSEADSGVSLGVTATGALQLETGSSSLQAEADPEALRSEADSVVLRGETGSGALKIDADALVLQSETSSGVQRAQTGSKALQSEADSGLVRGETASGVLQSEAGSGALQIEADSEVLRSKADSGVLRGETDPGAPKMESDSGVLRVETDSRAPQMEPDSGVLLGEKSLGDSEESSSAELPSAQARSDQAFSGKDASEKDSSLQSIADESISDESTMDGATIDGFFTDESADSSSDESIADAIGALLGGSGVHGAPSAGDETKDSQKATGEERADEGGARNAAAGEEGLPEGEELELPPAQIWPEQLPDASEVDLEIRAALVFGAVSSESGELGEKILEFCSSIGPVERKAWLDEPPEEIADPELLRRQAGLRFRLKFAIDEAQSLDAPPEARWELNDEPIQALRSEANELLDDVQKLADVFLASGEPERMRELNPLRTPILEGLNELRRACDRLLGVEDELHLSRLPLDHEEKSPDDEEPLRRRRQPEAVEKKPEAPRAFRARDSAKARIRRRVMAGALLSAALVAVLVLIQPERPQRLGSDAVGGLPGVSEVVRAGDKATVRMELGWQVEPAILDAIRRNLAGSGVSSMIVVSVEGRLIAAGKTSAPLSIFPQ